jgi:hypothetical protein
MKRLITFAAILPLLGFCGIALGGETETAIDRQINVRVYAVLESLGVYSPPDPPVPPPPPPPPPIPPPSPPLPTGLTGGDALAGFWTGWRGRHDYKFLTGSDYGAMGNNTLGVRVIDLGSAGIVEFDVYYDTANPPGDVGGQHLFSIASHTYCQGGPCIPSLGNQSCGSPCTDGWTRLDFGIYDRGTRVRPTMYHHGAGVAVTVNGTKGVVDAWKKWAHVKVEFRQTAGRVEATINGVRSTYTVAAGALPMGKLLVVGNVDRYEGDRCTNVGFDPCGCTGSIRFKNFRFTRL